MAAQVELCFLKNQGLNPCSKESDFGNRIAAGQDSVLQKQAGLLVSLTKGFSRKGTFGHRNDNVKTPGGGEGGRGHAEACVVAVLPSCRMPWPSRS